MILESLLVGGMAYTSYRYFRYDAIAKKKMKANVKKKWNVLMDSMGTSAENKINQEYEILDIFIKHYGFDMVISIPYSKKFMDIVNLIPSLESCFKANVMANTSEAKNSAYLRFHLFGMEISTKDKLRFDWFKTFYNVDGCMTKTGETIGIDSISPIESPTKEIVGYRVGSKIPVGLNYDKIKNSYDTITKTLGKCFLNFKYETMTLETSIIHTPIANNYKFSPIKIDPWELYVAMGHDWEPIILDYSLNANALIGGMQGTGKTNALMSAFINLCTQCNGDTYGDGFDLMVCNMGEKNDLRIFKNTKQCKYYANNETEVLSLLRYLIKEMDRRNKLFASQKAFCFNIHQYNKLIKDEDKKLKVIHLIADEIADFMSKEKGDGKEEIQSLLWDLIRKSRSSGIYITMATQRGSLKNLDSEIKGQFGSQICFSQPNTASALTIMSGDDVAKRVMSLEKKRECLVDYTGGIKVAKTLYLDERMMEELLRPVIVANPRRLLLYTNGDTIIPNKKVKNEAVANTEVKDTPIKPKKEPRFKNLINKKKEASKK